MWGGIFFFSVHDTNPFEVVSLISHCLLVSGAAQNKTLLKVSHFAKINLHSNC